MPGSSSDATHDANPAAPAGGQAAPRSVSSSTRGVPAGAVAEPAAASGAACQRVS
ncbi:hypothetical protein [Burkholderia sp. F1]|uniref:hypothetical protein n=1 Tax=Burkholderia sp. F1 TaxID=3366817 RepID=UPI003D7345C6